MFYKRNIIHKNTKFHYLKLKKVDLFNVWPCLGGGSCHPPATPSTTSLIFLRVIFQKKTTLTDFVNSMLKDTMKAFDDFKKKQKSTWSNAFWYVKVYIFLRCNQYILHWAPAHHSLIFIWDSYMWRTRFVSLKLCVGLSIFDSVSFLLKFSFLFNKKHGPLDFNRKAKHTFALFKLRPLIFKLQQQVLKFNDICVNWTSPKTGVEANFLNLKIEFLRTSVILNSNFWINIRHSFSY